LLFVVQIFIQLSAHFAPEILLVTMMVSSSRQSSDALGPKPNQRGASSDTMEWRRGGDTGSALPAKTPGRGNGRARGRGAGGRGRGGGRGPQGGNAEDSTLSGVTPSVQEPTPASADTPASGRTSRQKARKVPAPTSDDLLHPPTPQASRPRNLRRRSHQSTATKVSNSNSNPVTNKHLSVETGGRKAFTGPPTPSPVTKDLPPHLAPSSSSDIPTFDIRTNIDALVERVRAVAMDRPHTPGSHIDWAGDDDDSLPDLDDWGVHPTSSKGGSVGDEHEKMSPTYENVPQPNESLTKAEPAPEAVPQNTEISRPQKLERVRSKRGPRSRGNSRAQQLPPALEISADNSISRNHGGLSPLKGTQNTAKLDAKLHPSLPPKPLIPIEPINPRAAAPAATPMRNSLPPKPVTQLDDAANVVDEQKATVEERKLMDEKSISSLVPVEEPSPQPTPPRAFNPSHGRAHTVGRFPLENPPHRAPTSTFPHPPPFADTPTRSPLRTAGLQHSRNHSSPPVTRAPQAFRPVLTGDALSRLARTLGSPPRKESPASMTLTKD
jgi:hypothetical protein